MTRIVRGRELFQIVSQGTDRRSHAVALLLGGDRLSCCDEGIVLEEDGQLAGIATIAPDGEMRSGEPTIVALYVTPGFRKRGIGRTIFEAAVDRCAERGFTKVRVDVMSAWALRITTSLPAEKRAMLDVHDLGPIMDQMP